MMKKLKILFLLIFLISFQIQTLAGINILHLPAIPDEYITVQGHPVYYNEMGKGKPVLLVHGLLADKSQWIPMMLLLSQYYHVITLDLPGYGKSLGFPMQDYDLNNQVILLHEFMNKLKIDKFNMAGNSMGGTIAALYAIKYPSAVITLAFIGAPLGVISPHPSEVDNLIKKKINPFVPTNKAELNRLLQILFANPPNLSEKMIATVLQNNKENKQKYDQITQIVERFNHILENPMNIPQPVLIIWGDKDGVFDVSGAKRLQANLKNSKLFILRETGHVPQLENVYTTTQIYLDFLNNNRNLTSFPLQKAIENY